MKDADGLVFLTRRDIDRAIKKYGIEKSKAFLNPVCMEEQIVDLKKNNVGEDKIHILITGSFSYEPNEKGIIWFLEHVWKELENGKNQKNEGRRGCADADRDTDSENAAHEPDWHPGYERAGRGAERQAADSDFCL